MFRRIAPQFADQGLAAHPHRLVLSGPPGSMQFPPLCPNCGAAATRQVRLDKVFDRGSSEDTNRYEHVWVSLPMCAACAAQHDAEVVPPTLLQRLLSGFYTFDMVGAVVLGVAALFIAWLALKAAFRGDLISGALLLGLAALLAWFANIQRRTAWEESAHRRIPQPSEVARAFDFSDDLSQAFEKPRFAVTMKNAAFAQAFEALNAGQLYRADAPAARQESRSAKLKTIWLVVGLVILAVVLSWFGH